MATFRAITRAMDTAKAIAESEKIDPAQKSDLTSQVLQAASTQPLWDNWAQRLVAGGLAGIGVILTIFIGVAVLERIHIDAAVTSALTGTIGGLAGMFTTKALGSTNGTGSDAGTGKPSSTTTTRGTPKKAL